MESADHFEDKLDSFFDTYRKASAYDNEIRKYTFETFKPYLLRANARVLELGCSDGQMTERIANHAVRLDVVEGSARFLAEARKRKLDNVTFYHALFEEYRAEEKYDAVFATFVLTHIRNLDTFYSKVKFLLKPGGFLFVAVPNSRALSRQLALHMGLLSDLMVLTENDRNHGHCRAYDRVALNKELADHGFTAVAQGGIMLKPLADFQMDKMMEGGIVGFAQLDGMYRLGMEYPDLSATIYSVAKNSNG